MKTLADRIKANREKQGLTQIELAKLVGLDQTVISKLERGNMSETTKIAELASALHVDAYWLATGKVKHETPGMSPVTAEIMRIYDGLDDKMKKVLLEQARILKKLNE